MGQSSTRVPASAWTLGILSLAPFYITSAIYCYGPPRLNDVALLALGGWSAVILAYLGGIRAGLELASDHPPRWWSMSLSLLTPIDGFGLLYGALSRRFDAVWEISGFLLAFLLLWLWDVRDIEGPAWRPRYRTLITAGAAIALAFALEQALSM